MSQVDLSTLSLFELRGLLESARRRGQAAESYEILKEMADRRERGGRGGRISRAQRTPHPLTLSDAAPEPEADDDIPPMPEEAPLALNVAPVHDDEIRVDPELTLALEPTVQPRKRRRAPKVKAEPPAPALKAEAKPRGRGLWLTGGLAAGVVLGVGVGWGLAQGNGPDAPAAAIFPEAPMLHATAPSAAPPVQKMTLEVANQTASPAAPLPATAAPASAPAPVDEVPAEVATTTPTTTLAATTQAVAAAEPAAREEKTEVATAAGGCETQPTPADKVICETPKLQHLQKALRQAYADALAAHEDKATLRQRQLAWRDGRSTVTDPAKLASLYDARIEKLKAATAEARRLAN